MNPIHSTCQRLLFQRLQSLSGGYVEIVDDGQVPGARASVKGFGSAESDLRARIRVHNSSFYRKVVTAGDLGLADSLISGDWSGDDLTALVRIFIRSHRSSELATGWSSRVRKFLSRCAELTRRNTRVGARRNIHRHYDLSNEFFALWLDPSMSYSCAVFRDTHDTLDDASTNKIELACSKLSLQPTDHLLEIGSGWGGLAIYAAQKYGCRVTTTTISEEQYQMAKSRIAKAGLSDQVTVLKQDYRDLCGKFDKLISIEMIEAVGHRFMNTFFAKCNSLLRPDGMMLLQGITIVDQMYEQYVGNVDFIRAYIFPGGCLTSTSSLLNCMRQSTSMRLIHLDDMAPHYAETLRRWRDALFERVDDVKSLGFDDRFVRMWEYYLCYCEAAFEERQVNVQQLLFAMPECRHPHLPYSLTTLPNRQAKASVQPALQAR